MSLHFLVLLRLVPLCNDRSMVTSILFLPELMRKGWLFSIVYFIPFSAITSSFRLSFSLLTLFDATPFLFVACSLCRVYTVDVDAFITEKRLHLLDVFLFWAPFRICVDLVHSFFPMVFKCVWAIAAAIFCVRDAPVSSIPSIGNY